MTGLARWALLVVSVLVGCALFKAPARAHEVRPAYLQIKETAPNQFSVLWRTPVLAGARLPLVLKLPDGLRDLRKPLIQELADSLVERRWVDAGPSGLAGGRLEIVGLQFTITDALVRVEWLDGRTLQTILRPGQPWVDLGASQTRWEVAGAYVIEGVDHILFGVDHLLFVLGLLILVKGTRRLIATITAFTIAHSITLAAATLNWIRVPAAPVEACIALSIMFVAAEIVHGVEGRPGLSARFPWVVAFGFGLLHGLGFAEALRETGLPPNAIPTALLFFNVGVELGQLMFIAAIFAVGLGIRWTFRRMFALSGALQVSFARLIPAYAIGGVAAFWVIDRCAGF